MYNRCRLLSWGTKLGLNSEVKCTLSGKRPYEGGQTVRFLCFLGAINPLLAIHPIPSHPIHRVKKWSEVKCWGLVDHNVCRSSSHRQEAHGASPQIPEPRITQLPRLVCVYGLLREGVGICTHQETRILRLQWRLVSVDEDDDHPILTSIAAFLRTKIIVTHSFLCSVLHMSWWGEVRVKLLMRGLLMSNCGIGCCRLFNYGIGIHLLQAEDKEIDAHPPKSEINPRDDHISFQARHLHDNLT